MKGIVLVVRITLVKPKVIQRLDGMEKFRTMETPSKQHTLHGLSFQMLQKTTKNLQKSYIALWKPDPKSMKKPVKETILEGIASFKSVMPKKIDGIFCENFR